MHRVSRSSGRAPARTSATADRRLRAAGVSTSDQVCAGIATRVRRRGLLPGAGSGFGTDHS